MPVQWTFQDRAGGLATFLTTVAMQGLRVPYWIDALLQGTAGGVSAAQVRAAILGYVGADQTFQVAFVERAAPFEAASYAARMMTAQEQAATWKALEYVAGLLDLGFEPGAATGSDSLTFMGTTASMASYGSYPGPDDAGSNVIVMFPSDNTGLASLAVDHLMHEIGHAFGLKHPFARQSEGNALPASEQVATLSVMNYNHTRSDEQDHEYFYGPLDVAALQYLYGPSQAARSGNDIHHIRTDGHNFIWDGGGNDTLSAAALPHSVVLHLDPGHWDYAGQRGASITSAGQVTVNYGSAIENLIGGAGSDQLFGSSGDNAITGGAGDDALWGGAGSDTAVFSGSAFDYTVAAGADGWLVRDSVARRDGDDTLSGIELLRFADLETTPEQWLALAAYAPLAGGNDAANRFGALPGNQRIDGGAGLDALTVGAARAGFTVQRQGDAVLLTDGSGTLGTDLLLDLERVHFSDVSLAFDATGAAGQAYRLYAAAFGRTPDLSGFGFWIEALDHGYGLRAMAQGFADSPEFHRLYGSTTDVDALLTALYKNVLHRDPDASGVAWYKDLLRQGLSTAELLTCFSESPEFQAQQVGATQGGMAFTPWAG